ncbi:hypothetical protein Nmel_015713, partial [Mimus melanotis]
HGEISPPYWGGAVPGPSPPEISRDVSALTARPALPLPLRPPPRGEEPWQARCRAIRRHPPHTRPIPAVTGIPDTGNAATCPAPAVFPGMARGRVGAGAGKGQA